MATTQEFTLPSTNGKNRLYVYLWEPAQAPHAILQLSHGMCEHLGRYDEFACYLAAHGYLVLGNDHLGHGKTADGPQELGYFAAQDPSRAVVDDLHAVTLWAKEHYPGLPFFLLGHSMGSFLVRRYCMTYGSELSGCIIMGTGSQPAALMAAAGILVRAAEKRHGPDGYSPLLDRMSTGGYDDVFKDDPAGGSWLSVNAENAQRFAQDPLCQFRFTVSGYRALFDTISFIQRPENIACIPPELPLFFVAGEKDPVGNFGKGVIQVAVRYKKQCADVKCKLYAGDRHEILNENDRRQVYADLRRWMEMHL